MNWTKALPLAVGLIAALALAKAAGGPWRLGRPPIAFALFAAATMTLGTASAFATAVFFPHYVVPIDRALWMEALGIATTAAVVFLCARIPRRSTDPVLEWVPRKLDVVVLLMTAVCAIATVVAIRRIGYVPLFQGNVREERYFNVLTEQAGVFYRLSLLGVPAAILASVRLIESGHSLRNLIACATSVFCISLYGPRFFPVLVAGTAVVLWDQYRRPIHALKLLAAAAIAVPILVYAAMYREGIENEGGSALVTLSYFSFGEFRDFAASIPYFDGDNRQLDGATIPSAIVPLAPGKVWALVGVDKTAAYAMNSADVMSEYFDVTTGIRIGVVGELNMNFGVTGVMVGMAILGLVLTGLDRGMRTSTVRNPIAPFFALMTVLTVFTLVGQLNMYTSSLSSFGYPLLMVAVLASQRAANRAR